MFFKIYKNVDFSSCGEQLNEKVIFFEVFEIQIQMIFVEALFDGIQTLK